MPLRPPAGFISANYDPLKVADAPTIGTLSNAGETSLSVSFTAPTNVGGSAITSYVAVVTDSSSGAQFTASGSSSPISITGLTTGNTYTCRVFAVNSFGPSAYSATSNSAVPALIQGQQAYTTAGTYSWVAPTGVTSVSVVCVGGGAGSSGVSAGGYGGALGYKNNYAVTPGNSYTVVVGAGGTASSTLSVYRGGDSYFVNTATVKGGGATNAVATYTGDGGGNGGQRSFGGGGAGGYAGAGGNQATAGTGGSGGGGGYDSIYGSGAGGGGVGILGQGSNGAAGTVSSGTNAPGGGGGGSGGTSGGGFAGTGGQYGGGAGCSDSGISGAGRNGAVRIIWPGTTRSFPSTNTGDL